MYDVITIGSATRDVFLTSHALHTEAAPEAMGTLEACVPFGAKITVDDIHFDTGGGATNNAVTFARLGRLKTAALTRIGRDQNGRDIVMVLKRERVDVRFVQETDRAATAYATILSPGHGIGERTILVYRGASTSIERTRIPWRKLRARWFYLSSLSGDLTLLRAILAQAEKIGARVVMNPGSAELQLPAFKSLIKKLSFLIVNRDEAAALTGGALADTKQLLRELGSLASTAIMTDGAGGAYAVMRKEKSAIRNQKSVGYFVPSVGHAPKNITGAGDAFGSGFLTGFVRSEENFEHALRVGAINADSVVQHVGAKVGILKEYPNSRELAKLKIKRIQL